MKRAFYILYPFLIIGSIFPRIYNDFGRLEYICKPSLMILLGLFFYNQVKSFRIDKFTKFIYAALFFSFQGDVMLMFESRNESFFLLGLLSFLLAHLAYIIAFWQDAQMIKPNILILKPLLLLPILLFELIFLGLMYSGLGEMLIPVIVYASTISVMAIMAIARKGIPSNQSFNWVLLGALLFVVSDSIIGFNKFATAVYLAPMWIMLFYCIGQYYIIQGSVERIKSINQQKV